MLRMIYQLNPYVPIMVFLSHSSILRIKLLYPIILN
nr:MAG TPA: hypothetical protein [Bacteriophage sp.]